MELTLKQKCTTYNFKKLFDSKGYTWFDKGNYNLNIIGVRKYVEDNVITNLFDDCLVLLYNIDNTTKRFVYSITTEPGKYYIKNPINAKGTAILAPGQYRGCWKIGKHNGKYDALCQCKPVAVYRDFNKNDIYDLDVNTKQLGLFGINIHRSNPTYSSILIDGYSAGCQVFSNPIEFKAFLSKCKKQMALYGNTFTYTLINEEDMI